MLIAEQIKSNWDELRTRINTLFPNRIDVLNKMYDEFEERMAMMPAAPVSYYHNAFAGGYVDHILRVMDCASKQYELWQEMGADVSGYTYEELMFAALNHDLGKVGFPGKGNHVYEVETSDWHRKNMGRMYKQNDKIPFTIVPDLSLYLLQHYNIPVSWNEYLAIKIHDGIYNDGAKPYFMARTEQAKMKNHMPLLLHHADHMATQIEYERYANHKENSISKPTVKHKKTIGSNLSAIAESNPKVSEELLAAFKNFGKTD